MERRDGHHHRGRQRWQQSGTRSACANWIQSDRLLKAASMGPISLLYLKTETWIIITRSSVSQYQSHRHDPGNLFSLLTERQGLRLDQDVFKCIISLIKKKFWCSELITPEASYRRHSSHPIPYWLSQTAAWAPFNLLGLVAGLSLLPRCPLASLHFPFSPLTDH